MIGPGGFDRLYVADPDPFGVASRWYERRKQAVLVAALQREHYDLVWDCAAGTGHLALALLEASRCERLLATDAASNAVALTGALLAAHPAAAVGQNVLPEVPPGARAAELTVAAEVLYYLSDDDRAATMAALAAQPGEVVSVHWRHQPHDARLSGHDVTEELDRALARHGKVRRVRHDDDDFVLAGWSPRRLG